MKYQIVGLVALLAGSELALASTKQTVYCQNAENCSPTAVHVDPKTTVAAAKRDVEGLHEAIKRDVEAMDTMTSLFRRDPEYEYAMSILGKQSSSCTPGGIPLTFYKSP